MRRTAALGILFLLASASVHGIEAYRLGADEKIVLDGKFDEAAWSHAKPWDRFYEVSPQDKIEAKVRTEVRFAYDAHALYAAVRAHDPNAPRSSTASTTTSSTASARENSETISLVYGHRRSIGTSLYLGASFGRSCDADAGIKS